MGSRRSQGGMETFAQLIVTRAGGFSQADPAHQALPDGHGMGIILEQELWSQGKKIRASEFQKIRIQKFQHQFEREQRNPTLL